MIGPNKDAKWIICKCLYEIAKHLPKSHSKIHLGQKTIRRMLARGIVEYVGENVNIERNATFCRHLRIGDNSGIGINCRIGDMVTIGNNVLMGPDCNIYTNSHEHGRTDIPIAKQGMTAIDPVWIGDDVWLGTRVIIMPGVKIGKGSIIGAGSVVTHDIPEYVIAAGCPAVVKKYRKEVPQKTV